MQGSAGRYHRPAGVRAIAPDPDHSRPSGLSKVSTAAMFAVSELLPLYHQQPKNLLVSYSPKRLGFF
ncbi:hypothetical protein STRTUCAR8_00148 [Streptomyces turgidiscabies Car8]|uniref:Uncharacterized protein n=1 Tax=Streptomyces turgidiscabies (strain Car8) TaxID=698760 RepID=L7F5I8_STRT8|nr:hypothetical protein STRTUCAR8_00148 [Streptomyces turgidiscabies Car8]